MTPASDVLLSLYQRGVKLWLENGQLRYRAPRGALLEQDLTTLRELKPAVIELLEHAASSVDARLQPLAAGSAAPATALQRRWIKNIKDGRFGRRWLTLAVRATGPLDTSLLQRSIEAVVQRHESLRTRLVPKDGVHLNLVDPPAAWPLEPIDLTGLAAEEADREAKRIEWELVGERVDVSAGPLFGARLLKMCDDEHVLILAFDHLISDGLSKEIVNREIWTLYRQAERGQPFSLPHLPLQFSDYAEWQHRAHASWLESHAEYWKKRFAGAPRLRLPTDDGLIPAREPLGATMDLSFGSELSTRIHELARRARTLSALTVLAMFAIAISRWCRQRDLVLTFIASGRDRPEFELITGFLSTMLFLRLEIADGELFLDLLKRVTLEYWTAHEHRDFDRVPEMIPECSSDLHDTDVYFNWLQASPPSASADLWSPSGAKLELEPFELSVAAPSRFMPLFRETHEGIELSVLYRPDMFAPKTIEQFGRDLVSIAEHFTRQPDDRILATQE